jgi:glycine cleavage system H protein
MNGFSYTDIFETKGIEYLLIIVFLLLLVPFWIFLNRPLRAEVKAVKTLGVLLLDLLKIPEGLFYSRNHTWTHLERSGIARIGLDDLLLHLTGQVEVRMLRKPGEHVEKGEILAEISHHGKKLNIASPLSGELTGVNSGLDGNTGMPADDPYGEGWICSVRPQNWVGETAALCLAGQAREWMGRELQRFRDFIALAGRKHSPEAGMLVLQDGGELTDQPLSGMPEEVWQDFQASFLDTVD